MDVYYETKFSQLRQESGFNRLKTTHDRLLWFSLGETVLITAVTFWQVYYLKKVLDNRRLI